MQFPDEERVIRYMLGEVVIVLLCAGAKDDIKPIIGERESVAEMVEKRDPTKFCYECLHWAVSGPPRLISASVLTPYCGGFGMKWHHEISYGELCHIAAARGEF